MPQPAPTHNPDKPAESSPAPAPTAAVAANDAEWPGFRGPDRDSTVHGVRIDTDWSRTPPVQLWRRPIGPGWSSFAVRGDLIYTQEQRGDDENRVRLQDEHWRTGMAASRSCQVLGVERWRWSARNPDAQQRSCLLVRRNWTLERARREQRRLLWSRNVAAETKTEVPGWGFASSPLVIDDVVIVAADRTLVGYDAATGALAGSALSITASYSSPHRTTIDGVPQVLLLSGRVTSLAPANGTVLWEHAWQGVAIVQPAYAGWRRDQHHRRHGRNGTRRLTVAHGRAAGMSKSVGRRTGSSRYSNDFVVHNGYAFGFDGSILACIDIETGKRVWKGGRYGNGQLLLLPDQDLLLVLSEDGTLALVSATPGEFKEIARVPAIEGKTWNHPVLVGNVLLVRNGEEMAAFRLSLAGD